MFCFQRVVRSHRQLGGVEGAGKITEGTPVHPEKRGNFFPGGKGEEGEGVEVEDQGFPREIR